MSKRRFLLAGLLKILLASACLVGGIAASRFVVGPVIESALSLGPTASSMVRRTSIFAAIVLCYWGFAHWYERRPVPELRPRLNWTVLAAGAGVLSIGVTVAALFAAGGYRLAPVRGLGQVPGVLVAIWIAAVLEEVAFRGILFRILEERLGTKAGLLWSTIVFSVAHLGNNGTALAAVVSVALAGLMWGLIYVSWRNIWVVAAHHCCWNATIFMTGLPVSGEDWRAQAPLEAVSRGPELWTGGAFGPEASLVNIVVSAAICAGLWRMARHGREAPPLELAARGSGAIA